RLHYLVMPFLLLFSIFLFHVPFWFTQTPVSQEWVLGPFPQTHLLSAFDIYKFSQVNWWSLLDQAGNLVALLFTVIIAILFNSIGIELTTQKKLDLSREFKMAGVANVITSFSAGLGGYHSLNLSLLNYRIGSNSRFVG